MNVNCIGTLPAGATKSWVEALVKLSCRRAGRPDPGAVSVRVVDDRTVRALNRAYRGKDKVTDVLSFAYGEGLPASARRQGSGELGDIVISLPQVRRQAKVIGRTIKAEFGLMVVHGSLHLLGYDHESLADETAMFALQQDILMRAGIL
ncbi:MAG TPA: rRNA maturation RNase YbeY [Candidatus Binatia bacterium]|jgi:probable rRNA maturation factor|nr:rRNA maturation RNase YbeY [Candidatus Binatia bacterium]